MKRGFGRGACWADKRSEGHSSQCSPFAHAIIPVTAQIDTPSHPRLIRTMSFFQLTHHLALDLALVMAPKHAVPANAPNPDRETSARLDKDMSRKLSPLSHWAEHMESSICPALSTCDINMLVTLARTQIDNGSSERFDHARLNLKLFVFATSLPNSTLSPARKRMLGEFEEVLAWLQERDEGVEDVMSKGTEALLANAMRAVGGEDRKLFEEKSVTVKGDLLRVKGLGRKWGI
jgi:hypothetical protein